MRILASGLCHSDDHFAKGDIGDNGALMLEGTQLDGTFRMHLGDEDIARSTVRTSHRPGCSRRIAARVSRIISSSPDSTSIERVAGRGAREGDGAAAGICG